MKTLTLAFILLNFRIAHSQNAINYDSCYAKSFCVDCGVNKAEFSSSLTLADFFMESFKKESSYKGVDGSLTLQIIVDTLGNACCKTISNFTNLTLSEVRQMNIDQVVAMMPQWRPAITKNGKRTTVSLLLTLEFLKDKGLVGVKRERLK